MHDDDEDYIGCDGEDVPCDHDDYDTDILTGRCMCWRCGESWYATAAEMDRELRFQSEYAEIMEREDRRQRWSDFWWAVRHPLATIHWELSKRGWFRKPAVSDDDIPF
ncbi:hypothetical protein [Bradyrhizobium phage ppBeUSDA76-2]|nr:hypothetical protein [Bradyrhizobium elkanii]WAX24380.1 hypothetical protein [Bradyrhizobium phage ppBeUSDA76-2]MCP1732469.1 hypothetical protein [Bradyrhizobium elkanii]MCS3567807.1 hypothetical protein [Bradyrhizobium elkanii]MCS3590710.1 hypothetical protein [Bradyrhizobium elkanii]MCS3620153.1 hypothetical protein [Bradyrhizobium elkanii]